MTEELQKRLLAYLDAAERGIREAGPAVGGELEQLVREWLVWTAVSSFAHAAVSVAGAVVCGLVARWMYRVACRWYEGTRDESDLSPGPFLGGVLATAAGVGLTLSAVDSTLAGVKALVAPRVVVVEKVSELVKTHKPK